MMNLKKLRAKAVAKCDVRGFKVVAIAQRGGQTLMLETNRWLGRGKWPWTEHAEERLVRKMVKAGLIHRFRGNLTVTVLRFVRGGLAMAKPCSRCQLLLTAAGIKTIRYSTTGGIKGV